VITSDIRGIREQVGGAGLLVDPRSVEELAAALVRLWSSDELRDELVAKGSERAASYSFDDFALRLRSILDDAEAMRRRDETAVVL
jgi:glycosyltransferase involved in cell wall biosynthesis